MAREAHESLLNLHKIYIKFTVETTYGNVYLDQITVSNIFLWLKEISTSQNAH